MPAGEQTNVKQPNLQPKAAATAPRSAEYFSGTVSPTFLFKPAKTDSNRCVQVAFKKLRSGVGRELRQKLHSGSVLVEFLLRSGLSHIIAYDSRKHVYRDLEDD
jgi:hypothetical protein